MGIERILTSSERDFVAKSECIAKYQNQGRSAASFVLGLSASNGRVRRARQADVWSTLAGRTSIDWSRVFVFLVDERYGWNCQEESNSFLIRDTLIKNLHRRSAGFPESNLILPNTSLDSAQACAEDYQSRLCDMLEKEHGPHLVTIGLGSDGHIASVFPEWYKAVPDRWSMATQKKRSVLVTETSEFEVRTRICVNLRVIREASNILVTLQEGSEEAWTNVKRSFDEERFGEKRFAKRAKVVEPTGVVVSTDGFLMVHAKGRKPKPAPKPPDSPLHYVLRYSNISAMQLAVDRESHYSFVVMGAAGDLAKKKTFPSLFQLHLGRLLPGSMQIIGVDDPKFHQDVTNVSDFWDKRLREHLEKQKGWVNEDVENFKRRLHFIHVQLDQPETMSALDRRLRELAEGRPKEHRVFYLALPPFLFAQAVEHLRERCWSDTGWNRVVVEKPFGKNGGEAAALSSSLKKYLDEKEIFRMDHYLAKTLVLNLLTLRFANRELGHLFHCHHVANVRITFKEAIGVQGRAGYFDGYGIIRDIMQNHLMQVLTLVAMEAPATLEAEDVRDEKVKVLKQIRPISPRDCVIGQYEGYQTDPDIQKINLKQGYASRCPTFAVAVLYLDNERWSGVPFIMKAGKGLEVQQTIVRIQFKKAPPSSLFGEQPQNELVIRIQPNEAIYYKMLAKMPGLTQQARDVEQTVLDLVDLTRSCHGAQILKVAGALQDPSYFDVEELSCNGLHEKAVERCCAAAPAEKVVAVLQLAANHNRQQLASLEGAISTALQMQEQLQDDCRGIQEALLVPRAGALKVMLHDALDSLESVKHLVLSGLCRFCYKVEDEDLAVLEEQLTAKGIADTLAKFQRLQENIDEQSLVVAELDVERRCLPHYVAEQLVGVTVSVEHGLEEAVAGLLQWPIARRLQGPRLARMAILEEGFLDDFHEAAERLFSAVIAAPARLGHQLDILCFAISPRNHWSQGHPTAQILWGLAPELRGLGSVEDEDLPDAEPARTTTLPPRMANESDPTPDPDAAMGLVVLISNHTSEQTVQDLTNRLEGPHCLFLEDSCGTALEALGYNCHSGDPDKPKCLHPTHASTLATIKDIWPADLQPHFGWRRHAATLSAAHAAWHLGTAIWGPTASVWLMDFRPEAACPGLPLAAAVESVPSARIQIVKDPEVLFGMDPRSVRPITDQALRQEDPDTLSARTPLAVRISKYIAFHQAAVVNLKSRASGQPERAGNKAAGNAKILVYSCTPFAQCGGHGDRLNGIITTFLLAVLTGRAFFIDSESPLPLQLLLQPRSIDWRVSGGLKSTAGLRHLSYHDKRWQFEADLEKLAASDEEVLVINMNYRMIRSLFEAPAFRKAAQQLGLPHNSPPFLAAEIFDVLFGPTQLLRQELHSLRTELSLRRSIAFIGIHLRTGQIAWDPARHDGPDELQAFLDCARKAEHDLGLDLETPWLLATDSNSIIELASELPEAKTGKLRIPEARGRVHIDRSGMEETLSGAAANYGEWLLFGRAAAVVLSRSYFGETAAEVGRVRHAYFAPGGGCVRTDLSSS
ncbi:gsdA [Symbiodinium sp. CCMP2592]|nr:gsdA [Symbiodinium sp. CCMP2592]